MRETTVWDGARCDGAEHIEDLRCPMSDNVKENNRLFEWKQSSSRDTAISAQLENTDYDDLHYCKVGTGSRDLELESQQPSLHRLQGPGLEKQTKESQPTCTEDYMLNTGAAD
ncbi:hypothetical protein JOQ06_001837 [Pogonophryne albipinna]|uniref:Uncharacterized protein n=1 Tax=Pogonophryne albipinna TaxID=1090488 RepID=A0AAD6B5T6_9TELE|nr:hypothetical protein JOQ06_001837 [Pogonophryne albipinna]